MTGRIKKVDSMAEILHIIRATMPDDVYDAAASTEDSPQRVLFGYYLFKKLVGVCGYTWDSEGKYTVSWTAVLPECQDRGIGQKLMNKVIETVKQNGAKKISVETYEHPMFFRAIGFYMKNGFRITGFQRDYLRDGSSYLYMTKELV